MERYSASSRRMRSGWELDEWCGSMRLQRGLQTAYLKKELPQEQPPNLEECWYWEVSDALLRGVGNNKVRINYCAVVISGTDPASLAFCIPTGVQINTSSQILISRTAARAVFETPNEYYIPGVPYRGKVIFFLCFFASCHLPRSMASGKSS